ncbi:hypothetical protein B0A52_00377 [Exophiala mesophila]|uniref:Xylanolytic transcriptional activator regulatory domain-containing protein n=1 Tax=Exophiala mesophila TaxID=212818 RepID=A0A438NJU8_EXOME|nr:hypothetical protein B0A52_00377 [Exophiala mesophila]
MHAVIENQGATGLSPRVTMEESQPYKDLDQRLQALEDFVRAVKSTSILNEVAHATSVGSGAPASPPRSGHGGSNIGLDESRSLALMVDPVDGMGAVLSENNERSTFHARLGNIINPWDSTNGQNVGVGYVNITHSPESTNTNYHSLSNAKAAEFDKFATPPDALATGLIQHYFSDVGSHSLFPFLHQQSFMENYAHMKKYGPRYMRRTWLGLFNMVLAVATNMVERDEATSPGRINEAQTYYQRAVSLCDTTALSGASLELVQYLVSQTQYLQATQKSIQTGIVHSMSVNAAIRIGLHSQQASQAYLPLEREMRKRTWYMCMIFDRVLSMTLGQPPVIPNSFLTLDLPAHFSPDPLEYQRMDSSNTDSSLELFVATIKLYKIMGKVIERQYNQNLAPEKPQEVLDIITPLASMDNELREWDHELPPEMRTISSTELAPILPLLQRDGPPNISKRSQLHLTMRCLNLRLLLHRPVLVKYLETSHSSNVDPTEEAMLSRLGSHSIYVCHRSATEIIKIVSALVQGRGTARKYLNAWWFTLYYTFNAALVVFAVMMICHETGRVIPDAPSKEDCRDGLEKAIKALADLDHGNKMIERCHDYLERLFVATTTLNINGFRSLTNGVSRPANNLEMAPSQPFLGGHANCERNVADIMTGDDLGFLDLYFAPGNDVPSTIANSDFATNMDYLP